MPTSPLDAVLIGRSSHGFSFLPKSKFEIRENLTGGTVAVGLVTEHFAHPYPRTHPSRRLRPLRTGQVFSRLAQNACGAPLSGLLTATGETCGATLVAATVTTNRDASNQSSSGAIVTGYMTGNVVCFTSAGAAVRPALTTELSGSGSGTISSSPDGLGCASTCTGNFPSGTSVSLTATPNGSTFRGWTGCDTASGPVCTVNLTSDRTVTATFD